MLIHIGKEIKAELRRQGRGATWFARQLNYERSNVYKIFMRESIDTWLLQRICAVLGRNFVIPIARKLAMVRKMILQMCSIICNMNSEHLEGLSSNFARRIAQGFQHLKVII